MENYFILGWSLEFCVLMKCNKRSFGTYLKQNKYILNKYNREDFWLDMNHVWKFPSDLIQNWFAKHGKK